jgi:hypothetical protein
MEVAYYTFGNEKQPQGVIHDEKGSPLLEEGEVVLLQDTDAGCEVTRSAGLMSTMVFPDIGSGELFRTDRRIIFLRIPPISSYAAERHGWIDDKRKFMAMVKIWLQKGHRESVVIPVADILRTKRKRGGKEVVFSLSVSGQKYQVRITPSVRPFI